MSLKSSVLDFGMLVGVRELAVDDPEKKIKQKEKTVKIQNNSGNRMSKNSVVDFIQNNQGLTSKEIFNFLKNKVSKRTFQRYLAELKKSKIITTKLKEGLPTYYVNLTTP
ncbi:MAG: hypothetical protein HYT63_02235 [Candidatus Yanofskybacteria bacterium]|nr:hypothetical protein [Candidatus Yanofskybacteria bacterium]